MTPLPCETCAWFKPDEINPESGMGECMHINAHGYYHAMVKHRCRDHESNLEGEE